MPAFRSVIFSGFLLCLYLSSTAQFTDNFSDGDFTNNPAWVGNTADFIVNTQQELQLNAPAEASTRYLSTFSPAIFNASWEFTVRLGFTPSSTNLARIYLSSDNVDLTGPLNGYFVLVGGTPREISLFRQTGTTITKIIEGEVNTVNVAAPNVRVKVTRNAAGLWQLERDLAAGSNFVVEGTATDNTHTAGLWFGVRPIYTATRSTLFFFDNFVVTGTGVPDNDPPLVSNLFVLNENQLRVTFNEPVTQASATNTANYVVQGAIGSPVNVTLNNFTEAILTFNQNFTPNVTNTLAISGIIDLAGNSIVPVNLNFTFFTLGQPSERSVVFNELMPDPTPSQGLPTEEFIELHNPTNFAFNLGGWQYVNQTTVRILPDYQLAPGGYVILCSSAHTGIFAPFGDVIGINSWPALINAADSLTLLDNNGNLIDFVNYNTNWYGNSAFAGGGFTLEQINPTHPCSGRHNWKASTSPIGGTPGAQNSIFSVEPETTELALSNALVIDENIVRLRFNRPVDTGNLSVSNFEVNPSLELITLVPNFDKTTITLFFNASIVPGVFYTLNFQNITDCFGNALATASTTFVRGELPEPGEIIFNEIMADPTPVVALPPAEYIELFNRTNKLLDLSNARINTIAIPPGTLIMPNGFLLIANANNTPSLSQFGSVATVSMSDTYLTNSGRELILFNENNQIIDQLTYSDTWYRTPSKANGGWSLELINPFIPCSSNFNWTASNDNRGGTPGAQNSVFSDQEDNTPPTILQVLKGETPNQIIISFNEPIAFGSINAQNFTASDGFQIISASANNFFRTNILLILNEVPEPNQTISISLTNIEDCSGNVLASATVTYTAPALANRNDIIINELLFNQNTGGSTFVEIYNRSDKTISLQNWKLANIRNNAVDQIRVLTTNNLLMQPGDYFLITNNAAGVTNFYPKARSDRFLLIQSMPSTPNGGGTVVILDQNNAIMDSLVYSPDMHLAILRDTRGISLERIDPNRPTTDFTNWSSAAEAENWATPGYLNSQFFASRIPESSFKVYPEVFSPDNDGFDDVLNISYQLESPGLVANVTIYDQQGREVRKLVRNEVLGTTGTFTWNGISDRNMRARTGIHVIFIEIIDLNGTVTRFKKPCVVATRLGGN
ncbi:MAG: lamin tail domain-containing protein [Luteibaculaceae bacterium]